MLIELEVFDVQHAIDDNSDAQNLNKKSEGAYDADVVVIGAGPGGYTATFRCADLGVKVILIDKNSSLGGTFLNVGCVPSKALLHAAKVIKDVEESSQLGLYFKSFVIDIHKLRNWKQSVVNQLTNGIKFLANKRNIKALNGKASFSTAKRLIVQSESKVIDVKFKKVIIATRSNPVQHESFNYTNRKIMTSDTALEL